MKTIITVLTTAMLAIGATSTMAAPQGSDEAAGYALSQQAADDFDGPHTFRGAASARGGRDVGAYASARELRLMRDGAFDFPDIPEMWDFFYLDGR